MPLGCDKESPGLTADCIPGAEPLCQQRDPALTMDPTGLRKRLWSWPRPWSCYACRGSRRSTARISKATSVWEVSQIHQSREHLHIERQCLILIQRPLKATVDQPVVDKSEPSALKQELLDPVPPSAHEQSRCAFFKGIKPVVQTDYCRTLVDSPPEVRKPVARTTFLIP